MTKEEKELLLIDLCARLPYEVKIKDYQKLGEFALLAQVDFHRKQIAVKTGIGSFEGIAFYKLEWSLPYLRPMSSMTEEEKKELNNILEFQYYSDDSCMCESTDWLNKHQFDYRGLIEKGLAIEAPEKMYKN